LKTRRSDVVDTEPSQTEPDSDTDVVFVIASARRKRRAQVQNDMDEHFNHPNPPSPFTPVVESDEEEEMGHPTYSGQPLDSSSGAASTETQTPPTPPDSTSSNAATSHGESQTLSTPASQSPPFNFADITQGPLAAQFIQWFAQQAIASGSNGAVSSQEAPEEAPQPKKRTRAANGAKPKATKKRKTT
jgi:hypothetical protein